MNDASENDSAPQKIDIEALLNATQRLSKVGGWQWDVATQSMHWTDEVYRIHDFDIGELQPGTPEHIARSAACYRPEDRGAILDAFRRCAEHGEPYDMEMPFTSAKGRVLWIRTTAQAVIENGAVVRVFGNVMDVTERRRAEEDTRRRERTLQKILDILPVGLWFADKDGTLQSSNPKGIEIWGAEPHVGPAGYGVFKARRIETGEEIAPGDWALAHSIRDGITVTDELLEIEAFDGKKKIVLNYTAPVLDDSGAIQGAIVVNRDITTRYHAERRYRGLFDNSISAVALHEIVLDGQGHPIDYIFIEVNPAFERHTSLKAANILGKRVTEVLPGIESTGLIETYGRVALTGEPVDFELFFDLTGRHYNIKAFQVGPNQFAAVFEDIGDRKRAEAALKRRLENEKAAAQCLRILVEPASRGERLNRLLDVLCRSAGVDRTYIFRNEDDPQLGLCAVHIHESVAEGIEPQFGNPLLQRSPYNQVAPSMLQRLQARKPWANIVSRLDGPERDVLQSQGILSVLLLPILNGSQLWGFIGFDDCTTERLWPAEDIELLQVVADGIGASIQREQIEEALRKSEERLGQIDKMNAIGQLAGGVAHDFNNQLAIIMGYAEMLQRRLRDPDMQRYAELVLVGARRSADLTKKLLAFARKGQYESVPVDMHEIIHEVVEILNHSLDKRIAIKQVLGAPVPATRGDASQLQNALLNLAINARDAMPEGGEVYFETGIAQLDEGYCSRLPYDISPGAYLRVCVTDTGAGIPADSIDRIFEPFYTTKEAGKGTGMGLAAVYGTVKHHGGAIAVYSEPGHGSTFKLFLPLDTSAVPAAPPPVQAVAAPVAARVFVVDDEETIRQMAHDMLTALGHTVTAREDGEAALEHYREHWREIDLVILDMIMPRMNGQAMFDAMREINPGIKALLASGYSINGAAQKLLDAGVRGFLQKPFEQSELAAKVAAIVTGEL